MRLLLGVSDALARFLGAIASLAGWLFLVTTLVICFDVVTRKLNIHVDMLSSTKLQELEWHLHGALFLLWLGYCYVHNAHVRIDVFTANLSPRTQAWIEVVGCLIFAIPYCLMVIYYGFDFAERSYLQNEFSDAPTGLPHRWIIKSILAGGLVLLLVGVISVLLRRLVFLFGPPDLSRRAQEAP